MKRFTLIAVVAACLAALPAHAQDPAHESTALERAHAEMAADHWRAAFDAFAALADQGHAQAARVAHQMWLYAPKLYGQTFPAELAQVQRWEALCDCVSLKARRASQPAARSSS